MGLLDKLKTKAKETVKDAIHEQFGGKAKEPEIRTYNREFKVAGVTFTNDDNAPRQEILKAIKEHKKPFEKRLDFAMQEYSFEGNPAINITVNGQMIGNIPHDDVPFFLKNGDRMLGISNLYVGGDEGLYWARVKVVLKSKDQ